MSFEDIYQDYESGFEKKLCQGDIFKSDCIKLDVQNKESISGWILINATCDLVRKDKTDFLKFIPIRPLDFLIKKNKDIDKKDIQQLLSLIIRYDSTKAFFLPPSKKFGGNISHFAELGYVISVHVSGDFDKLKNDLLNFRIVSLRYPWKEKLSELVSNSICRIGVPDPPENWKTWRDNSINNCFKQK